MVWRVFWGLNVTRAAVDRCQWGDGKQQLIRNYFFNFKHIHTPTHTYKHIHTHTHRQNLKFFILKHNRSCLSRIWYRFSTKYWAMFNNNNMFHYSECPLKKTPLESRKGSHREYAPEGVWLKIWALCIFRTIWHY